MGKRTGTQATRLEPAGSGTPPATRSTEDERHERDGYPDDYRETGLDAYVTRLVNAAPPLTSEQRDTLALLLRCPHRRRTAGQLTSIVQVS